MKWGEGGTGSLSALCYLTSATEVSLAKVDAASWLRSFYTEQAWWLCFPPCTL